MIRFLLSIGYRLLNTGYNLRLLGLLLLIFLFGYLLRVWSQVGKQ